jgi:hypothetical protein
MNTDLSERERGSEGERERGREAAQVVEMRTDVIRTALWQAPVQAGQLRLPGELRSPHQHHNCPNFNHLRSAHNSQLTTHNCGVAASFV